MGVDPDGGLFSFSPVGACIGAVAGGLAGYFASDGDWRWALIGATGGAVAGGIIGGLAHSSQFKETGSANSWDRFTSKFGEGKTFEGKTYVRWQPRGEKPLPKPKPVQERSDPQIDLMRTEVPLPAFPKPKIVVGAPKYDDRTIKVTRNIVLEGYDDSGLIRDVGKVANEHADLYFERIALGITRNRIFFLAQKITPGVRSFVVAMRKILS
jgi:hypothetical protein